MKKLSYITALLLILIIAAAGCTPQPGEVTEKPAQTEHATDISLYPDADDYTNFWWMNGIGFRRANVQTGNYGFSFDEKTGEIRNIGAVYGIPKDDPRICNETVRALPAARDTDFAVSYDNTESHVYSSSYVHVEGYPMSSEAEEGPGVTNALRILSSGTYLQRFDVYQYLYENNDDLTARVEFACVSDSFTVTYQGKSTAKSLDCTLSFSLTLAKGYEKQETAQPNAIIFKGEKDSIAFFASDGVTLSSDGEKITVSAPQSLNNKGWTGFSFTVMPGMTVTDDDIAERRAASQVQVSAKNTAPQDGGDADVSYNPLTGAFEVEMPSSARFMDSDREMNRNAYERTPFEVTNNSDVEVTALLCFYKNLIAPFADYNMWGQSPMILDYYTKEPTGISVQYCRNPHNWSNYKTELYGACWVNCYVRIKVPAHGTVKYEFTVAGEYWGSAPAASAVQMCLIGWGGNQWWLSTSLGSKSETFGLDPENGCGRSLICDSRPFSCRSASGPGGTDWLNITSKTYEKRAVVGYRISIQSAPCVSKIFMRAKLDNGSVDAEMTITITRSNDYARMLNTFKYTFNNDVAFSRLAFYSLGADNYNSDAYKLLAFGNEDGTTDSFELTDMNSKNGYLLKAKEITGKNVWVSQTGFVCNNPLDVMPAKGMVVREYNAMLNGKEYTNPSISVYVTNNGTKLLSAELSAPAEIEAEGKVLAGSVVTGTVEYLIPPSQKEHYEGTGEYVRSIDEKLFDTPEFFRLFAVQGAYSCNVTKGTQTGAYPVVIAAKDGRAEFSLSGGTSYIPVTITGLKSFGGYTLYKLENGAEVKVNQEVQGNDFWQCVYNQTTGEFERSYNLPAGEGSYILKAD